MKQKQSNISKILVSLILVLFLLILVSSNVYAWFTARARYEDTPTFATLEVDITSGSTSMTDSSFTTTYLNNVYPGSTISFNSLSISNTGNEAVYTIVKLKLKFEINSNSYVFIYYYNLDGERIDNINLENNTAPASLLNAGQSDSVNLSFTLNGDEFTNDFKQTSIEVTFTALAIQSTLPEDETGVYPTDGLYAVYYLVEEVDTDTDVATYTRLDYLTTDESSTNPYILLDYYANQNSCCEIKYLSTDTEGWVFGARRAQNNSAFGLFYVSGTSIWPIWGTQTHSSYTVPSMENTEQVDTFINNIFYKNGTESKTFTCTDWSVDQVYSGVQICLFNLHTGTSFDNRPFDGRFYYMHIWDDEDELMLIPVVDSNGTVCVYDTINQQFYYSENEGTFGYSL